MLILDDSPIGACVVFMAPKTGATSLTAIAERNGEAHRVQLWDKGKKRYVADFHEINVRFVGRRDVVLTVRDPRERLLSLWRHYCYEEHDIPLADFCERLPSFRPFFSWSQVDWYRRVLELYRPVQCLRLEKFDIDVHRLLGWQTEGTHLNGTTHGPWQDYEMIIEQMRWWWDWDAREFGYL